MKKAQISSAFNYITAAIIIGVVLIFGTISIIKLMGYVNKIDDQQFRKEFVSAMDRAGSSLHSVQYIELSGLKSFKQICFFDSSPDVRNAVANSFGSSSLSKYATIQGDLMDTSDNIYLLGENTVEDKFENPKISVDVGVYGGYVCANVTSRGTIAIKLEGLGKKVAVSLSE